MGADRKSVKDSVSDSAKDPLVGEVRAAVAASSAQAVALKAGVSDETVYALLRGAKIGKGTRRLLEDAVRNPGAGAAGAVSAPAAASSPPAVSDYAAGMLAAAHRMSQTLTAIIEEAMASRGSAAPAASRGGIAVPSNDPAKDAEAITAVAAAMAATPPATDATDAAPAPQRRKRA